MSKHNIMETVLLTARTSGEQARIESGEKEDTNISTYRHGRPRTAMVVHVPPWSSTASFPSQGARCSSVVRAFAHGAMGRRIDPSWGGPIELFLVPASAPRLV